MSQLLKSKHMQFTLISGLLILVGLALDALGPNYKLFGIIAYALSMIIGGWFQTKEGVRESIEEKHLNVDVLMVAAAIGASLIDYWLEGALLIFIFSLSGSLEEYATDKSTQAISALMNLQPEMAKRYKADGTIETIETKELMVGDQVLVSKGEQVPIDGEIIKGTSLFDESAISGESIPRERTIGDEIIGGTINTHEAVVIQVTHEQNDTLFAKIIRLVEEAQSTPSKTATFIEGIENRYVTIVLIMVPIMIAFFYFILNWTWNESFYRGMVLLTVASPCALVASATPATLSAISNAAKNGILFKGGAYVENFSEIDCIAFDKTGTITEGKPKVVSYEYDPSIDANLIGAVVVALESTSTHPLANALIEHIGTVDPSFVHLTNVSDRTGYGLEGEANGAQWKIGKQSFIVNEKNENEAIVAKGLEAQEHGQTVIYVSKDNQIVAYYSIFDAPKAEAKPMIAFFKSRNVHTVLITGDNEATGQAVGKELDFDEIRANCLPEDKATILVDLKEKYKLVAMVGDGINDAPALANADVGIAMGKGTDIAMESADMVLMYNEIEKLKFSVLLSEKLKKVTLQNIIFSITVILILIAANLFQFISLPLGVVGHEGSTILVILNGLRLLRKVDY